MLLSGLEVQATHTVVLHRKPEHGNRSWVYSNSEKPTLTGQYHFNTQCSWPLTEPLSSWPSSNPDTESAQTPTATNTNVQIRKCGPHPKWKNSFILHFKSTFKGPATNFPNCLNAGSVEMRKNVFL